MSENKEKYICDLCNEEVKFSSERGVAMIPEQHIVRHLDCARNKSIANLSAVTWLSKGISRRVTTTYINTKTATLETVREAIAKARGEE